MPHDFVWRRLDFKSGYAPNRCRSAQHRIKEEDQTSRPAMRKQSSFCQSRHVADNHSAAVDVDYVAPLHHSNVQTDSNPASNMLKCVSCGNCFIHFTNWTRHIITCGSETPDTTYRNFNYLRGWRSADHREHDGGRVKTRRCAAVDSKGGRFIVNIDTMDYPVQGKQYDRWHRWISLHTQFNRAPNFQIRYTFLYSNAFSSAYLSLFYSSLGDG